MNKPSIFSFFSGCGILDLGFERVGYNVVAIEELGEDASELKFPPRLEGGK